MMLLKSGQVKGKETSARLEPTACWLKRQVKDPQTETGLLCTPWPPFLCPVSWCFPVLPILSSRLLKNFIPNHEINFPDVFWSGGVEKVPYSSHLPFPTISQFPFPLLVLSECIYLGTTEK